MIKLSEVFTNYGDYQIKVIDVIKLNYVGAEWLDDALNYTKQESLYNLLMLKYGDRYIRYDNVDIFINKLIFDLTDILPDIFAKQQVFIKNKLAEFLSDEKNRAVIIDSTSANTRDSNSNSKVGNSASPLNLVINTADEILNAPITSSNLSNIKLLENYDGKSNQVNYNFVNDLVKTLNADYSLRLSEFMSFLSKHFVSVVGGYYRPNRCNDTIKGDGATFNNGYKVNEVNYYGEENKQAIQYLSGKVEANTTSIQIINGKIVDLQDEINNIDVSGIKKDIENIKQEQEVQNNEIENIKQEVQNTEIENLNEKVNQNTSDINTVRAIAEGNTGAINLLNEKVEKNTNDINSVNGEVNKVNLKITSIENKQIGYDREIEKFNNNFDWFNTYPRLNTSVVPVSFMDYVNIENFYNKLNDTTNYGGGVIFAIYNVKNTDYSNSRPYVYSNKYINGVVDEINNNFSNYYSKPQFLDYSIDWFRTNKISVGYDNLTIDNYSNTEIVLTAPQKITCITNNNGEFRTETRQDGFYINNKKAQPTINVEIFNNNTKITDIGDNKVMVIAQVNIDGYKNSGQDLFNALPEVVRNLSNVNDIEYFEYNFIQVANGKNKVFTNCLGNVAASVYSNRIYLRNENNLPGYVGYIRFKLVYDKI